MLKDRKTAGRALAGALRHHAKPATIVLALPHGGVPIGDEIADALGVELDVWVVRKLGLPAHPELAMGALGEGGTVLLDDDLIDDLEVQPDALGEVISRERAELARRTRLLRGDTTPPDLRERTVILVDDGIATGATMSAAIRDLRDRGVGKLIVAVPVAAPESLERVRSEVDEVECLVVPHSLHAVGVWYERFDELDDAEVVEILDRAHERAHAA